MKELNEAGLSKDESKVLEWFFKNEAGVCRDIEHDLFMRQPIVSVITRDFLKKKWLSCKELKNQKKGRPEKQYKLSKTVKSIIDDISEDVTKKIQEYQQLGVRLEKIAGRYDQ